MNEKTLHKIGIVTVLAIVSLIGFMVKLPRVFSAYDKELHLCFYFFAALVLNYLLVKKNVFYHVLVAWVLFLGGVFIESAQSLSNLFVKKRIHGNFDSEDVMFNIIGLLMYSFFWIFWRLFRKFKTKIK
jgi:VanZ family protein